MIRLQQIVVAQAKQILRDDDKIAGVTRDLILSFEFRMSKIFLLTYERKLFGFFPRRAPYFFRLSQTLKICPLSETI